jgi:hypothetical protein
VRYPGCMYAWHGCGYSLHAAHLFLDPCICCAVLDLRPPRLHVRLAWPRVRLTCTTSAITLSTYFAELQTRHFRLHARLALHCAGLTGYTRACTLSTYRAGLHGRCQGCMYAWLRRAYPSHATSTSALTHSLPCLSYMCATDDCMSLHATCTS